jgi:hypothetical protein
MVTQPKKETFGTSKPARDAGNPAIAGQTSKAPHSGGFLAVAQHYVLNVVLTTTNTEVKRYARQNLQQMRKLQKRMVVRRRMFSSLSSGHIRSGV